MTRILKLSAGAAVLAVMLFATLAISSSDTHTARAATSSSISCDFSNAHPGGGNPASVTCTFTLFGKQHTLVVSFTDNNPAGPSRNDAITGCTLDTKPIRICALPGV